jgi:hypothetical protein
VKPKNDAFAREIQTLVAEQPSLVAAGQHVLNGQATLLRRLIQPWQIRAYGYYDMIGEVKYASQFYSRTLSNLRLYVAKRQPNGDLEEIGGTDETGKERPVTPDDAKAIARLEVVRDPGGGGRTGLLASYGRHMFLTGETYLLTTENIETGLDQWEMLSTDELRLNDGLYTRFKAPSLPANQFRPAPDDQFEIVGLHPNATDDQARAAQEAYEYNGALPEAVAYRLWKRHPRFSDLADSTMQGVLDICEELVLLTQAVRARARSRMAGSGILFLDDRITTTPLEPTPDEDPLVDLFVADLTEAMTLPIVDEGTAAAVVPLIARVRVPEGMKLSDLVYHLQIIDPTQVYPETGLRNECIRRLAYGLDMPADILLGVTDANHWSAWLVDEQSWKAHLQPVAQQLVEDLTSAYLGPALKEDGVPDWMDYVIAYDASAVINHPDRGKDAQDLFQDGELSGRAYRQAKGFDESDAPDEDERNRYLGIKLRDSSLAVYGEPSLKSNAEIEPTEGTIVGPTGVTTVPTGTGDGESAAAADKTPPDMPESPPSETVIGSAARLQETVLLSRIEGAAMVGLLRAREAAGAKIRNAARKDRETEVLIDGVHARDVAWTLGRDRVRALPGIREADLVDGAGLLIRDAITAVGVDDTVAQAVADTVLGYAARTLYDQRPSLNGNFPQYVLGLLAGR